MPRRLLLAGGTLFLAAVVIPWTPRRFSWDVMLEATDWFDRLWPPFLLLGGVASLAAWRFLEGRLRAGVAAGVGATGYVLWFLVEPPNMLMMWDGAWQMVAFLLALVAIPVGLLARRQLLVSIGTVGLAAALLAPVATRGGDHALLGVVVRGLTHPEKLMWQETAALLCWVVLVVAALASLLLWAARSRMLERTVAVTVIVWPATLALLTGVLHLALVSGDPTVAARLPIATLAPLILAALGAFLTMGAAELLPERRA